MKPSQSKLLRYFLAATSFSLGINSILSIIGILRLPSEPTNSIIFSLSASRLLLLFVTGLIGGLSFSTAIRLLTEKINIPKIINSNTLTNFSLEITIASFIFLLVFGWLFLVPGHDFQNYQAYFIRLNPLFGIVFHFSAGSFVALGMFGVFSEKDSQLPIPNLIRNIKYAAVIFCSIFIVGLLVAVAKIGITPLQAYWGEAEPPIMGYQLILTLFLGGVISILYLILKKNSRFILSFQNTDKVLFFVLWIIAAVIWINLPFERSFFLPNPTAPNFDYYPYSDAATYDQFAHSILVGSGFTNQEYSFRPVYVTFLALLQLFAKNNYSLLIHSQMVIFAVQIPFLYLLGKSLHRRMTGFFLALTGIFVESNSILSSSHVQVTNSQLLLTEFPTGLFLLISAVFAIKWLKEHPHASKYFYLMGGIIGLSALIRLHTLLVLLGIFVLSAIQIKDFKVWVRKTSALVVFVFLILFPWAFRNYLILGAFSPNPNRVNLLLESRWNLENDIPEDTNSNSNYPNLVLHKTRISLEPNNPKSSASSAYIKSEGEEQQILELILHHYFHNEILSLFILPLSYQMEPIDSYFENTFKFDNQWEGALESSEWILLTMNLVIVSFGIAVAYNQIGIAGLVPLAFQLTYNLSNALVRTSGWRYLKPVNWVIYTYFFIGIVELLILLFSIIVRKSIFIIQNNTVAQKPKRMKISPLLLALAFFIISGIISFGPAVVNDRYKQMDRTYSTETFLLDELSEVLNPAEIDHVSNNPNTVILVGRGLHPRFYYAYEGIDHVNGVFYDLDFSRLEFYLIGKQRNPILLKFNSPPEYFPNGSDVLVLGCKQEKFVEAFAVVLLEPADQITYISNSSIKKICP